MKNEESLIRNKLSISLQLKIPQCYFHSVLLHGCEYWTIDSVLEKHIRAFKMYTFRCMGFRKSGTFYVNKKNLLYSDFISSRIDIRKIDIRIRLCLRNLNNKNTKMIYQICNIEKYDIQLYFVIDCV